MTDRGYCRGIAYVAGFALNAVAAVVWANEVPLGAFMSIYVAGSLVGWAIFCDA